MTGRALAGALALFALAGCQKGEPAARAIEPAAGASTVAAPASSAAPAPLPQQVRVHVPSGAAKAPLVVFLHGLGGSGAELVQGLNLEAVASARGFAFIAPDGVLDRSGRRFWNATDTCCNFDGLDVDHVAALREWITQATADPRVDPERVYIVGFSNGGFMAYRAACEIGSLLRGIVSIAGAGLGDTGACKPPKKLSVLQIHGDRDRIVKYDGGFLFGERRLPRHPSAEASVAYWASVAGCVGALHPSRDLDLRPELPGAETRVAAYSDCAGSRVELWTISGGDHLAGLGRYSLEAISDFIARDAAPETPGPR